MAKTTKTTKTTAKKVTPKTTKKPVSTTPVVHVSAEIANAFGMHGLPNTIVHQPSEIIAPSAAVMLERITEDKKEVTAPYKVDVRRGDRLGVLSSQWHSRPDDERFLTMRELSAFTKRRREIARDQLINAEKAQIDIEDGSILINGAHLNNWAMRMLCTQVIGAPESYLKRLPAKLTVDLIHHGLKEAKDQTIQALTYKHNEEVAELADMSPQGYHRIWNHDVVELVERLVGHDIRWKVPGQIDWSKHTHNPNVEVTKDTTTLYAGDRNMFIFLCQDADPIECGKLDDGSPDYYFPGFYVYNSEVYGHGGAGIATFYLRGVCQNRNLWGVEGFNEVNLKHTKNALKNFMGEATPQLIKFTESSYASFIEINQRAKELIVAKDKEEAEKFLRKKLSLSAKNATMVVNLVEEEEGHPMRTLYDAVQGVTAFARQQGHQDVRMDFERRGRDLLALAA